jgi:hypothetical protein
MLFKGRDFWKEVATYDERDVEAVRDQLAAFGHSLICLHDGSFPDIDVAADFTIRMAGRVSKLPDYEPKLWLWSRELHDMLHGVGERRFAYIDLDCVVLDDPAPLLTTDDPVRLWSFAKREPYNTSLFALDLYHGNEVWSRRDEIPQAKTKWPYWTGDQSFVGYVLGAGCATFGPDDGVVNFSRRTMQARPPAGAKVVFFCGPNSPRKEQENTPWVRAHLQNKAIANG